jgi:hypothetical protein
MAEQLVKASFVWRRSSPNFNKLTAFASLKGSELCQMTLTPNGVSVNGLSKFGLRKANRKENIKSTGSKLAWRLRSFVSQVADHRPARNQTRHGCPLIVTKTGPRKSADGVIHAVGFMLGLWADRRLHLCGVRQTEAGKTNLRGLMPRLKKHRESIGMGGIGERFSKHRELEKVVGCRFMGCAAELFGGIRFDSRGSMNLKRGK